MKEVLGRKSRLTSKDFEKLWGEKLDKKLAAKIARYPFIYKPLSAEESRQLNKFVIENIYRKKLIKAGEHRRGRWEKGWTENLRMFSRKKNFESLIPVYHQKNEIVQFGKRYLKTLDKNFEAYLLAVLQEWIFGKYLRGVDAVYEFGCGTGQDLFRIRAVNKNALLYALDWAKSSQEIIKKIKEFGLLRNLEWRNFDFFHPDYSLVIRKNSAVVTSGALEQVGKRFIPFVKYLLLNKPLVCVHLEPSPELFDKKDPQEKLTIDYFKRRGYLWGFLDYLKKLEKSGKVKIHEVKRTHLGNIFAELRSIIVWSPVNKKK